MGNKNKQSLIYLLPFVLFISLFCFYWFLVTSSEREDSSLNQSLFSKDQGSPENFKSSHSMNRPESSKTKNKKIRSLIQTSVTPVFKTFDLSLEEVELFHGRRYEPREATSSISGLKIDRNALRKEKKENLPFKLIVPLPGGEGKREFIRTSVDFQNRDIFVWVGVAKDNKFDTFHLSVYQGAIVGSIETSKGSYEIKQLTESKNIVRKLDMNKFPSLHDDVIPPRKIKPAPNKRPLRLTRGPLRIQLHTLF